MKKQYENETKNGYKTRRVKQSPPPPQEEDQPEYEEIRNTTPIEANNRISNFVDNTNNGRVPHIKQLSKMSHNINQKLISKISEVDPVKNKIAIDKTIQELTNNQQLKINLEGIKDRRQFVIASLILVGGLIGFMMFDSTIDLIMNWQMRIVDGNLFSYAWRHNPIPIIANFYMFELANSEQFLKGAKPRMIEHGPFTYKVYRNRDVIEWGENEVSFMEYFEFLPESESVARAMETRVKVINYPIFVVVSFVKDILDSFYASFLNPIVLNIVEVMLRVTGEKIIEERSIQELMAGRQINLLAYLEFLLEPMRSVGIPIPQIGLGAFVISNSSFGFVKLINSGRFGPFQAHTKTENGHIATHFITFQGKRELPNFKPPCSMIKGSGGILFGLHFNLETVVVYNYLACRPLVFKRKRVEYFRGIRTIRFEMDEDMFNMSVPKYQCYCYDRSFKECDGWTNAAGCYSGITLGISFPHFYKSSLRQSEMKGLKPSKEKHVGFLNIEPNLGIPLNAFIGFQGNLPLKSIRWVPSLSSIPNVLYPVFWASLSLGADPIQAVGALIGINMLAYGSYLLLMGSLFLVYSRIRKGIYLRNKRLQIEVNDNNKQ